MTLLSRMYTFIVKSFATLVSHLRIWRILMSYGCCSSDISAYYHVCILKLIYTPPSKSLASLGAQAARQSIDTHFGILTVNDNHKLGLFCHHKLIDQAGPINIQQLCRGQCDFGGGLHYRTVFARWAIQPPRPHRHQHSWAQAPNSFPTSQLYSH